MLAKFQNHINQNFPFFKEKKLLLAVSGGVDSMVLVHLCYQLQLNFAVAHCNFQLRSNESDEDEAFVISQIKSLSNQSQSNYQIPLFVQEFETKFYAEANKLSIQVVARNLRYDWFETLLQNENYDFLLTAHHLDDSIETFLINFTRGTGLNGLIGIPQYNDKIIRPLLIFSRSEIETFAKENAILWREDSSNASDKYLRNKLRHHVIPVLKELNPSLLTSFEQTIENLQQAQSLIEDAVKMVYEKVVLEEENQFKIDLIQLLKFPNYRAYLFQWLHPFGFKAWEDIYDLVHAQTGKQIFSETHILLKDRNLLVLFDIPKKKEPEVYFIEKYQSEIKIPLKLSFCRADFISNQPTNSIFVDEDKLQFPLTIRKWQEGDIFHPFGMKGKKKVSKYFKDEKLSLVDKTNIWLLCSNDEIVWIIGKRQDERFRITENTTKILEIKYEL